MENEKKNSRSYKTKIENMFFKYILNNSPVLFQIIYDKYFRAELHKTIININFEKNDYDNLLEIKENKISNNIIWCRLKDVPRGESEKDFKDIVLEEEMFKYFKFHLTMIKLHFYHSITSILFYLGILSRYYFKRKKTLIRYLSYYTIFSGFLVSGMLAIYKIDSSSKPYLEQMLDREISIYNNLYQIYA